MKKFAIIITTALLVVLLSSCTTPSTYQELPPRDMLINGKSYKVTNVRLCDSSSDCNVWIIYPAEGTGGVTVQSSANVGKHSVNVETIIVP